MTYEKSEMTVSTTIQIMFYHKETNAYTICKVDVRRLNWKLRKLQKEGMFIVGIFFEDPNKPAFPLRPKPMKGDEENPVVDSEAQYAFMTSGGQDV